MSEHPIDRIFRERLANQKAGPTEHLWAGIAQKQKAIRDRRRLAYMGAILVALSLLVLAYLLASGSSSGQDANPENPVSNPGPVSTENPIAVPLAQNESTPDSVVDDGQLAESSPSSFANQLEEPSFADNGQRQTVSSPSVIESVDQSALIPDQPTPVTLSSPPSAA
ncbi:MAG: hypothetical protein AAFR97_10295, partial [Bacteroidota bacterium]